MIILYNDYTLLLMKIYSLDIICILHILLLRNFSYIKKYTITFFSNTYILLIWYWCRKRKKEINIVSCNILSSITQWRYIELIPQNDWISEHPQPNLRLILVSRCLAWQEFKNILGSCSNSEVSFNYFNSCEKYYPRQSGLISCVLHSM